MKNIVKNQKGIAFIETLIALVLLGLIGTAFMMALSVSSKAIILSDELTTSESLARSQMEYIKQQDYDDTNNPPQYSPLTIIPSGYTITPTAERLDPVGDGTANDDGIQKITVTIQHHGKEVYSLEGYKVDR